MTDSEFLTTTRLRLRRPRLTDATEIYRAYAGDVEVTRYLAWSRHVSVQDTEAFVVSSDAEWARWGTGPLLIERRDTGELIGGTGLALESPFRASTGYVLARPAWGSGYASEALAAVLGLARAMNLWRVEAMCHVDHDVSARVLEKAQFMLEGRLRRYSMFPNLQTDEPEDVLLYALVLRG